jgi:methylthioribose-1-phosphate isomerase
MYLVVDETYYDARPFHDTARYLILEWIYQLAAKSEEDLIQVAEFLEKSKENLQKTIPGAVQMNWYINRIFENFRGSDKTTRSIKDIGLILKSIQ